MSNTKIAELDKLFLEVGKYRDSVDYMNLFNFIKKFPDIAPFNAMLAHVQKPGSQFIASAGVWRDRFDRTIKPNAQPIVILRPFGPVSFVFDISDTDGKGDIPDELINPFRVEGNVSKYQFNRLVKNLMTDGIEYSEAGWGASSAGLIQIGDNDRIMQMKFAGKEMVVKILYEMVVNRSHSMETKFATMLHELGHLYCGHLGTPDPKWWDDRTKLTRNQREFEAESVCWLVCERLGLKNPSAEYLNGYLEENQTIPDISIDTVLKSAGYIESMVLNAKSPRKEIVISSKKIDEGSGQMTIDDLY